MNSRLNKDMLAWCQTTAKHKRSKIAVLDTGYDANSDFFDERPRWERIKGWKDFVSASDSRVDTDGHGTFILSLIMKIAPMADVYVARVAAGDEDFPNSADNIAKVC